jgi:hypothetical protein
MKNARFAIGAGIIAAAGGFVSQHVVLVWLGNHPVYDAIIAAVGIGFHAYNTYVPTAPKVS